MANRKPFLLRVEPRVLAALQKWADDELRSLNGQIEYLLRQALRRSGRFDAADPPASPDDPAGDAEHGHEHVQEH